MSAVDEAARETGVIVLPAVADGTGALSLYSASRVRARDYASDAVAPNTRRAYRADWRDFSAWCARHRLAPLPATPETVAVYLADLAGHRKPSTITRRMSAIAQAH